MTPARRTESVRNILRALVALATVAGLGSLIYLLVLALAGGQMTRFVSLRGPATIQEHHAAWPWLLIALLSALTLLATWATRRARAERTERRERAEIERLRREREEAVARLEQLRAEGDEAARQHDRELDALRRERDEARQLIDASQRERDAAARERDDVARERDDARAGQHAATHERDEEKRRAAQLAESDALEREWNHRLQKELDELRRERGPLGDYSDIKSMVLRLATTLLQAEKGLLLTRREDADGDVGDGRLEVVAVEGFDNDPADSALVHRFGSQVLQADETVREDTPDDEPEGNRTAADQEIHNLVAIPIYIQDEFSGAVLAMNREGGFDELDDDVLLSLGNHAGAVLDNHRLHADLRTSYLSTVRVLGEAIAAKDAALRSHSDEVAGYVVAVADRLGIPREEREDLLFGSLLHDVGKIGISERILLKPGRLTPEEFGVIKLHPRIGSRLVEQVPALRKVVPGVLHHHERFDGTGYPSGLRGEEIPLPARIIAVADAFSAMIAPRPYRELVTPEKACAEIKRCAGSQFDPQIVDLFCEEVRSRPPGAPAGPLAVAFDDPDVAPAEPRDGALLGSSSLSMTDSLTLLYSHRYFHEHVEAQAQRAADQGHSFSVLTLQLDGLGEINVTAGFAAGDEAIRGAAAAAERAATRAGGTACRYSGRRLALILPGVDALSAQAIGVELCRALESRGIRAQAAVAAWQEGEAGIDVAARALSGLTR